MDNICAKVSTVLQPATPNLAIVVGSTIQVAGQRLSSHEAPHSFRGALARAGPWLGVIEGTELDRNARNLDRAAVTSMGNTSYDLLAASNVNNGAKGLREATCQ